MYNILVDDNTDIIIDYGKEFLIKNDKIVVLKDGVDVTSYSESISATISVHWVDEEIEAFVGGKYLFNDHNPILNPDWVEPEGI